MSPLNEEKGHSLDIARHLCPIVFDIVRCTALQKECATQVAVFIQEDM